MIIAFIFSPNSTKKSSVQYVMFPHRALFVCLKKAMQLIKSQAVHLLKTGKYWKISIVMQMTSLWKNEKEKCSYF